MSFWARHTIPECPVGTDAVVFIDADTSHSFESLPDLVRSRGYKGIFMTEVSHACIVLELLLISIFLVSVALLQSGASTTS